MGRLTDNQVMEACGFDVRGFEGSGEEPYMFMYSKDGEQHSESEDFSPTTNTDDALALVPDEVLSNMDSSIIIRKVDEGWYCNIINDEWSSEEISDADFQGLDKTLPLAICKALMELNKEKN
jgi:hypothetical protein